MWVRYRNCPCRGFQKEERYFDFRKILSRTFMSEQRINEWRQHRRLREDRQRSIHDSHDHQRQQPELLAFQSQAPELTDNVQFDLQFDLLPRQI